MTKLEVQQLLDRQKDCGIKSRLLFLSPPKEIIKTKHFDIPVEYTSTPFGMAEVLGYIQGHLVVAVEHESVERWLSQSLIEELSPVTLGVVKDQMFSNG